MKKFTVIAAALALVACANRPESIPASFVSHEKFADIKCEELAGKLGEAKANLADFSRKQNDKANGDALGVFLLGIPFSKLSGDHQADVAKAKGEVEAIETAKAKAGCR